MKIEINKQKNTILSLKKLTLKMFIYEVISYNNYYLPNKMLKVYVLCVNKWYLKHYIYVLAFNGIFSLLTEINIFKRPNERWVFLLVNK